MKKTAVAIAVVLLAGVPATVLVWHFIQQKQQDAYRSADVKIVAEGIDDNGFTLIVRTPPETMYYCPGVRFGTQGQSIQLERPTGHKTRLYQFEFVRAPVGRMEHVGLQAKPRGDGSLAITFPFLDGRWEKGDRIVQFDPKGKQCGSWECLGQEQSKTTDIGQ